MNLLVLDTVAKSIEVALTGAVATNEPHFVSTWADSDGTSFTEGATDGLLSGATDVTAVASPAADTQRIVKSLAVYNADTADVTLLVKYDNGTNQRTLVAVTLNPGDTWTLDGVFTSSGQKKYTTDVDWGQIEGTLSNQTDLQSALDDKADIDSTTIDLSLDANFTGGELTIFKAGRIVNLMVSTAAHSSASSVSTADGIIPGAFRPSISIINAYSLNETNVRRILVSSSGQVTFSYYDLAAGGTTTQTDTGAGSVTYISAS